ncbi:NAD-dependent epimerase [Rubricoccus marinus]|uniref:NAD-dependent epimerase/dehydratase domain-containing protein n=1 Tax=Rubricoccus marinus TaxID=716817 RepID=A0A259TW05_9BACT|nr:NAD-dependent epimerase [Rubricoccus marinus]OZC01870.1 hypothetical protein BSZ36_02015 [Rubricoccus marinus]
MTRILVTGAAGFIGFHTAKRFLAEGVDVVGVDNLNDYYDPQLKADRLTLLAAEQGFDFHELDLADGSAVAALFDSNPFDAVINLAAQVGVRYSVEAPDVYVQSNLVGFANILEGCRHGKVGHLVYASSSSVYGANTAMPYSTKHSVDHPMSFYAATKKANEVMAHSYSHLYGLPSTGLRFFTVYGPWGRPDMALFLFTEAVLNGDPINVYNEGRMQRDFTYVGDVVEGIYRVARRPPTTDADWSSDAPDPGMSGVAPFRVYNIGNSEPVELLRFIRAIEEATGCEAKMNMLPIQPGDVPATYADVNQLMSDTGYQPSTSVEEGVARFVHWYREYYKVRTLA